ncbi:MAG: TetR/AcrR family transcriptional regulator [Corynebacterium nuruki]|nr:TetR/AcrR family transcriptional regulator [Corynebacterium nuruki]
MDSLHSGTPHPDRRPRQARHTRGRRATFTADDIVDAALDLGIGNFALADIAARLGVGTPALYRLFPHREAVLDACLARIATEFRTPDPGTGWQGVLRLWGTECWDACERHPGLAPIVYSHPAAARLLIVPATTPCLDAATAAGLSRLRAGFGLDFVCGVAFSTHATLSMMSAARLQAGDAPGPVVGVSDPATARRLVEEKIDIVVRGLAHDWGTPAVP